ncbi:hypothetical protein WDU94_015653 [Cyamophila willieti]
MWDIIKSHKSSTKKDDCNITADQFNDNFCDAPSNIVNSLPPATVSPQVLTSNVNVAHVDEEFYFLSVSESTVHDAMFSLTKKKGRDFYGLNLELILAIHDLITPVLAKLVNFCLAEGVFPDCLKCLVHVKTHRDQYTSFNEIHSHDTRQKDNLALKNHRVNAARNGPNYYAIILFNKIPSRVRSMPLKSFKILMTDFLKREVFYSIDEFLACRSDAIGSSP